MTFTCPNCAQTIDSKDFDRSGWVVIPTVGDSDPLFVCPKCVEPLEPEPDGLSSG